jgi:flavin-binding protein dodecin
MKLLLRIGVAASLVVSAAVHAYLYIHGYQHIPMIGTAFLIQASVCFALALLIVVGGPGWLSWAGAAMAGGSLMAFVLSRTIGLFGFSERGWDPSPQAAISVAAEVLTVLLWASALVRAGALVRWRRPRLA